MAFQCDDFLFSVYARPIEQVGHFKNAKGDKTNRLKQSIRRGL